MKNYKFFFLIGIIAFALTAKSQKVTVGIGENTSYTGLYDVKLYVLDVYTQNYCLVGEEANIGLPGTIFDSNQIDLTCVDIVIDQQDRNRYVAYVTRQEATGNGQGWTQLLDTGEMWREDLTIEVQMN